MKKMILMLMAASVIGVSCTEEPSFTSGEQTLQGKLVGETSGEKEDGCLLIKLTESAVKDVEAGKNVLEGIGSFSMAPVMKGSPANVEAAARLGLHQWYELRFDDSVPPEQMAEEVSRDSDVTYVEYSTLIEHSSAGESTAYTPVTLTKASAPAAAEGLPFDDPMLAQQWHLINEGNQEMVPHSVAGADVGVKDAWRLCTGDSRIIVAVFDEGVMTFHPDLTNVLWVNEAEKAGTLGVDDDGNKYNDDINGYNFYDDKGYITASGNSSVVGHGTHVAGSIAAQNGNGIGVSSIAGGSGADIYDGVRIMSCQIFKGGNKTSPTKVANAFRYAADNGACVAQCSFGSLKAYDKNSLEYSALLYFTDPSNANCEAVDRNIAVFAAGNYNAEASLFPGAYDFCISVTAIGPDYLPGGYSNHGPGCNIAAPGGNPCLVAESEIGKDMRTCILSTGVTGTSGAYGEAGYVYNYGTSMACPQVSGVVALGLSYALQNGKSFSRDEFVSRLFTSANDIDGYMVSGQQKFYNLNTGSYDFFDPATYKGKMGTGTVDAWKFLMALDGTPTVMTSPSKEVRIRISDYAGDVMGKYDYKVSIDDASKSSLGLSGDPVVNDGYMTLTCSRIGSGKITLTASVEGRPSYTDPNCSDENCSCNDGGVCVDEIAGYEFSREISVVSRSSVTNNGGLL